MGGKYKREEERIQVPRRPQGDNVRSLSSAMVANVRFSGMCVFEGAMGAMDSLSLLLLHQRVDYVAVSDGV